MTKYVAFIVVTLALGAGLVACYRSATPAPVSAISSAPFHSDTFHLSVNVPVGWGIADGPSSLSSFERVDGQVAFNSWGQRDFWAGEVHVVNTFTYSAETVMSQVADGGAFVALVAFEWPTEAHSGILNEYASNDLRGLCKPHDWRLDAKPGAQFISFFKWNVNRWLEIACRANASDATVAQLNYLLQSWRFDVDPNPAHQPPVLTTPPQFTVVTQPFVFDESQQGTHLPWGSTIYHWKNGITEVIGPDNSLILIARDAEATVIYTPGGPKPATRGYGVPSGASGTSEGSNQEVMKWYSGNLLVVTVVEKADDFQYVAPGNT